ncbi:MAG TPA: DUF3443 family protein [Nitrospirota bacterium]|nr:DUF3443 family protein [Nitrospirota bacterium]
MKSSNVLILLCLLVLTAGCGGGGGGVSNTKSGTSATLVRITVSPTSPSIAYGMSEPFTLTGTYSDSSTKILTAAAIWNSSNPSVATFSNLTGVAASSMTGTTTIGASYGGFSQSTQLTVTPAALVSITVAPASSSIAFGTTEQFTATGTYTDNTTQNLTTSATWISSAPAVAVVSNATGSNGLVTSQATGTTGTALIMARSGLVSGSTMLTVTGGIAATANNVLSITVNGSLCSSSTSVGYVNKPCVSVKVCAPGSTTACTTVSDILLDTGSFGLRIFKTALTVPLTQVTANGGSLAECAQFGDGSSEWGPINLADVVLGNETAASVPIQVIDSTFGTVPGTCGTPDQTPEAAGFNGILGVGVFGEDCGSICTTDSNLGLYYSCNGSVCNGTTVPLADQVHNPVVSLPTDSNGVIVELPDVSLSGASSANGNLVLGIGTETNNIPPGVTTYSTDEYGEINTVFSGTTYAGIIDSGSNGLFFTSPSASMIPNCSSSSEWFCPSTTTTLSAVNNSASGSTSGQVLFSLGNFVTLANAGNNVFSDIGAEQPSLFDWGLPFYFGRFVYVGIEGQGSSLGIGPYFAY